MIANSWQSSIAPVERVLDALRLHGCGPRRTGRRQWASHCPGHGDSKPSLSVSEGDDGRVLVHCHAGCTLQSILFVLGLKPADLFPTFRAEQSIKFPQSNEPSNVGRAFATAEGAWNALVQKFGRPPDCTWEYHNSDGELVGLTLRWNTPDGKEIRPISRHPDGWRLKAMPEPRPLYGLPEILKADPGKPILVVEGERCCDIAKSLGFVVTTSAGGSGAAALSDWCPLTGRTIWLLPDNDAAGERYASDVAGILTRLNPPAKVRIVRLPGLAEGEDIEQWVARHSDTSPEALRAELKSLVEANEPQQQQQAADTEQPSNGKASYTTAADLFGTWLSDVERREPPIRYELPPPFNVLDVRPGRCIVVGGMPGVGKTSLILQVSIDLLRLNPTVRLLFANVEMPPLLLLERIVSRLSSVPLSAITDRTLTDQQLGRVRATVELFAPLASRLAFLHSPYSIEHVITACQEFQANIVVLDYVQRFTTHDVTDKREQLEAIMAVMRELCDNGVTAFVVSAVARQKGSGGSTYDGLGLASFRSSSELEFSADSCYLLYPSDGGVITLGCLKNRYGPLLNITAVWNASTQTFSPLVKKPNADASPSAD